jgi:hypothetical protein
MEVRNAFPITAAVAPLRRSSSGANTAILKWRHYGDHLLAPLRRSCGGANMPIPVWLHSGDH